MREKEKRNVKGVRPTDFVSQLYSRGVMISRPLMSMEGAVRRNQEGPWRAGERYQPYVENISAVHVKTTNIYKENRRMVCKFR